MKPTKNDPTKTMLVLTVGFLGIFGLYHYSWAYWTALFTGLTGVFSPFLSQLIDKIWMKLAWLLGKIFPNILLTIIFYLVLFPLALLKRVFGNKDPMQLRKPNDTTFQLINKSYEPGSFEKPW